jgi:hypothetical protein
MWTDHPTICNLVERTQMCVQTSQYSLLYAPLYLCDVCVQRTSVMVVFKSVHSAVIAAAPNAHLHTLDAFINLEIILQVIKNRPSGIYLVTVKTYTSFSV